MIAEVIINRTAKKLNRTFDYYVPIHLEGLIFVGSKVLVPFGNSKNLQEAFVVGLKEKTDYKNEIKEIAKLEENLKDEQIELAKLMLKPEKRTLNKEKRIQDKKINCVYLAKSIEEIEFDIEIGKIKSEKQKKVINFVKDNEGVTIPEIEMLIDVSRAIVNTLIRNNYLEIVEKKLERNPLNLKDIKEKRKKEYSKNLELTEEKKIAYKEIEKQIDKKEYKSFLLHGVTGSRKNRNLSSINTKSIK